MYLRNQQLTHLRRHCHQFQKKTKKQMKIKKKQQKSKQRALEMNKKKVFRSRAVVLILSEGEYKTMDMLNKATITIYKEENGYRIAAVSSTNGSVLFNTNINKDSDYHQSVTPEGLFTFSAPVSDETKTYGIRFSENEHTLNFEKAFLACLDDSKYTFPDSIEEEILLGIKEKEKTEEEKKKYEEATKLEAKKIEMMDLNN